MTSFLSRTHAHVGSSFQRVLGLLALALAMTVLGAGSAAAHEHRTVATTYTFTVGFIDEPAIAGEVNGISLEVTKGDAPVEGLADTLKAQIAFGDQTKDVSLVPVFNTPGAYEAVFIPTAPGDYTFHFTGTVEGTQVDETFTSSPEGFDSVADRADYEFPAQANGSSDVNSVAMPVIVGAVLLAAGAFLLYRRRVVSQA